MSWLWNFKMPSLNIWIILGIIGALLVGVLYYQQTRIETLNERSGALKTIVETQTKVIEDMKAQIKTNKDILDNQTNDLNNVRKKIDGTIATINTINKMRSSTNPEDIKKLEKDMNDITNGLFNIITKETDTDIWLPKAQTK